jgi:hypothetical protein
MAGLNVLAYLTAYLDAGMRPLTGFPTTYLQSAICAQQLNNGLTRLRNQSECGMVDLWSEATEWLYVRRMCRRYRLRFTEFTCDERGCHPGSDEPQRGRCATRT